MKKYLAFLSFWAGLSTVVSAQNFYNSNGTTISILKNDVPQNRIVLFVKDTIINDGLILNHGDVNSFTLINKGELNNNGNLLIRGSWISPGAYDPGEGQITFNGTNPSIPQIINHNSQSVSKLVISGGGLKQILADLTVEESLVLTDGIITAQNDSKVHFSSTAVITGGSDNAHINAPVYQEGTGTKIFPVGNGAVYLPVQITGITANAEVGVTLTELQNGQTLATRLGDISNKRYWAIDLVSGSLSSSRIILPVEGDEGLDALKENEYVVAFSKNISEDFVSLGRDQASSSVSVQSEKSPAEGLVTLALLSENQSIVVFNAISPDMKDGLNDYIHIDNLVETDVVSIYNRWGDLVFEMKNYDNDNEAKRFNGQSNVGGSKDLPTGNYFYVIRRKAGKEVSGYLSLRR